MTGIRDLINARLFDDARAVTPADGADLPAPGPCQALYVGGAGALIVDTVRGATVTFAAVPAGTTIHLRCKRVRATGTVATSIVALYSLKS